MSVTDFVWSIISAITGEPIAQLRCGHPDVARDYRLRLLREEEAWDAYEMCMNCGKEWHD